MTKKELSKKIATEAGITHQLAIRIVQKTFDEIIETLVNEGRIELRNFGVFRVKKRRRKKAHVVRTGARVIVPQRMVVTFKAGRWMVRRVNQLKEVPKKRDLENQMSIS